MFRPTSIGGILSLRHLTDIRQLAYSIRVETGNHERETKMVKHGNKIAAALIVTGQVAMVVGLGFAYLPAAVIVSVMLIRATCID
jgi:hypothetical protein